MKPPIYLAKARLPMDYDTYVFDLYGTLVDIHTEEQGNDVWEKLSLFFGYYDARYEPEELKLCYSRIVKQREAEMKNEMLVQRNDSHEAFPEIDITEVFRKLYEQKGVQPDDTLAVHTGQFFRVLSTEYVRLYRGTDQMLEYLKEHRKKIYLLSNAQRIFTEYEMHVLGISPFFNGILISSDYAAKKPDRAFFEILIKKYQIDAAKTLFVGNDSVTDIAGAAAAGMDTFYVHSNISPKDDHTESADYIVEDFTCWETL